MTQKEFEIQKALGTINPYDIKIQFPRREEPIGLDLLITKITPKATRFFDGVYSIFMIEMPHHILKYLYMN